MSIADVNASATRQWSYLPSVSECHGRGLNDRRIRTHEGIRLVQY